MNGHFLIFVLSWPTGLQWQTLLTEYSNCSNWKMSCLWWHTLPSQPCVVKPLSTGLQICTLPPPLPSQADPCTDGTGASTRCIIKWPLKLNWILKKINFWVILESLLQMKSILDHFKSGNYPFLCVWWVTKTKSFELIKVPEVCFPGGGGSPCQMHQKKAYVK